MVNNNGCQTQHYGIVMNRTLYNSGKAYLNDLTHPQSIRIFRVCLGLTVMLDLVIRGFDLTAFYTDWGVLPRFNWLRWNHEAHWSVHLANGQAGFIAFLFFCHFVAAGMMCCNKSPRFANIASWALMVSLQNRNAMITYGADDLLRLLLFWNMFLPNSSQRSRHPLQQLTKNLASLAYIVQIAFVYLSAAALKSPKFWWQNGSATSLALELDHLTTSNGIWLRQFPEILKHLTRSVYLTEFIAPLGLLAPSALIRNATLAILVLLHCGLALFMKLGLFPLVNIVALIPMSPAWLWTSMSEFLRRHLSALKEHFHGIDIKHPFFLAIPQLIFLLLCLCAIITINIASWSPTVKTHRLIENFAHTLRIDQFWDMFAPRPMNVSGWYVIPGFLANGATIDLLHPERRDVNWSKPTSVSSEYKTVRWGTYFSNLRQSHLEHHRAYLSESICSKWNNDLGAESKLKSLSIVFMKETIDDNGLRSEVERDELWRQDCEP